MSEHYAYKYIRCDIRTINQSFVCNIGILLRRFICGLKWSEKIQTFPWRLSQSQIKSK